jgi:hypothetical protein
MTPKAMKETEKTNQGVTPRKPHRQKGVVKDINPVEDTTRISLSRDKWQSRKTLAKTVTII